MVITTNKINNIKIKPLIRDEINPDLVVGFSYFEEPYSNICILGKKKSGKTNLLYNILRKCLNKETEVFLFSSTVFRDITFTKILETLDKKHIEHQEFIDIEEDGSDHVQDILNQLRQNPLPLDRVETNQPELNPSFQMKLEIKLW